MNDEMDSLMKNQTRDLVGLLESKRALHNKWVYRLKEEHDGTKRYKARMIMEGFQQRKDIDFNEIFSHVVKLTTIRSVLSIVAAENLHLKQVDFKTAFLHGDLEEDVNMMQPHGYIITGKSSCLQVQEESLCF